MSETSPAYSANWEKRAMHLAYNRDRARNCLNQALKELPHSDACAYTDDGDCICSCDMAQVAIMQALEILEDDPPTSTPQAPEVLANGWDGFIIRVGDTVVYHDFPNTVDSRRQIAGMYEQDGVMRVKLLDLVTGDSYDMEAEDYRKVECDPSVVTGHGLGPGESR